MVLRYRAPISTVERARTVVTMHPVIIEFKGVPTDGDVVAEDVIALDFQGGLLKDFDHASEAGKVLGC